MPRTKSVELGYVPATPIAMVHVGLGEIDDAMAWFEQAYRDREAAVPVSSSSSRRRGDGRSALGPVLLKTVPRFLDLLRRVEEGGIGRQAPPSPPPPHELPRDGDRPSGLSVTINTARSSGQQRPRSLYPRQNVLYWPWTVFPWPRTPALRSAANQPTTRAVARLTWSPGAARWTASLRPRRRRTESA